MAAALQLRAAASMTHEDLATAAGIGRLTLVRIEKGDAEIRDLGVPGIDLDDLLGGLDQRFEVYNG